jgi:hypothetical protein
VVGQHDRLGAGGERVERGRGPHEPEWAETTRSPGEAAQAVKHFGLGANENIETLFCFVWILIKRFQFEFKQFLNAFRN